MIHNMHYILSDLQLEEMELRYKKYLNNTGIAESFKSYAECFEVKYEFDYAEEDCKFSGFGIDGNYTREEFVFETQSLLSDYLFYFKDNNDDWLVMAKEINKILVELLNSEGASIENWAYDAFNQVKFYYLLKIRVTYESLKKEKPDIFDMCVQATQKLGKLEEIYDRYHWVYNYYVTEDYLISNLKREGKFDAFADIKSGPSQLFKSVDVDMSYVEELTIPTDLNLDEELGWDGYIFADFNNEKYVTGDILVSTPIFLQQIIWNLIDVMDVDKSILQTFELCNFEGHQKIVHTQLAYNYKKVYIVKIPMDITAETINVFDFKGKSTMMFSYE